MTPRQIAKQWAKENSDYSGELVVLSIAAKGLGGRRGTIERRNRFIVRGGHAVARRDNYANHTFNGACQVCGTVYLERVIKKVYAPDPEAGHPVDVPESQHWKDWPNVRASFAYVQACAPCIESRGLVTDDTEKRFDEAAKLRRWNRKHPTLAAHKLETRLLRPRSFLPEQAERISDVR